MLFIRNTTGDVTNPSAGDIIVNVPDKISLKNAGDRVLSTKDLNRSKQAGLCSC